MPADAEAVGAIGRPASELDTPACVLDLDALEHNIELMAARCRSTGRAAVEPLLSGPRYRDSPILYHIVQPFAAS